MATKIDSYIVNDDNNGTVISGDAWEAQTFTVSQAYNISAVKLKLLKSAGTTPGTITVSIKAVDGDNKPTGVDLAVGTTNGNTLVESGGEWRTIVFAAVAALTSGTMYAIVVRAAANYAAWRVDASSPAYATGMRAYSVNGGTSWTLDATDDHMFETYDDGGAGITSPSSEKKYSKELIAIGNNEVWRESTAGTMAELTAANGDIDTSDKLNVAVAFQKMIIANGTNLKVADFVNTKIVTDDIGTNPPDFGTVITGASGASMIVDYITSATADAASVIYGKRTTTTTFTASDTITGTNPSTSPYGSAVSFTMTAVAEVAPPHWYDYTVFGADATNYGAMPSKAYQVCKYRGRIQLCGDPNYPHQWYQSRQLNIFDFLYAAGDAQSPVAGNDADCGEVGDIVKVAIPYSDDYLIYGCANELWVMSGDAAFGGELYPLDQTTGILGDRAWCWDDKSNLYLMCTAGLLRIPKGFGQHENLTRELWPDFINDLAFDSSLHRVTLAFNSEDHGIHIFKTTLADGVSSAWWYDLRTEGLFPDSYSADHGAFSAFHYQAEDPDYRKLLIGCNDGYIRFLDRTAKNDDSTAIDSYVGFAPLALSTHPRKDGIIKNFDLVSGGGESGGSQSDSSDVTCSVHIARTAEKILEKLSAGTTAAFTKTFTAPGWSKSNLDRRSIRGQWGGVVLSNNTAGESWSMERLILDTKEVGRSL